MVTGLPGCTPKRRLAMNRDAQTLAAMPTSMPSPVTVSVRRSTMRSTRIGVAPRASRMPISLRRRAAACAVMP